MQNTDGYNCFVLNCQNRRGGGIAIYVGVFRQSERSDFSAATPNYKILTLKIGNEVVYRLPKGNAELCLNFFNKLLDDALVNKFHFTCGGDFNIINVSEDKDRT